MLPSASAFLAGICLLFCCRTLPDSRVLAVAAVCLAFIAYRSPATTRRFLLLPAGFLWAAWHVAALNAVQLPKALEGQDLLVRGEIIASPERLAPGRARLRFRIDTWRPAQDWRATALPVRITWYRNAPALRAGERWQLRLRLKRPHGLVNPGGFDYERWLFAQGIRATGYVRRSADNRRLTASVASWQRLRGTVTDHLQATDIPAPQRALLRALAVGDRAGLSREQWQTLQRTGTSHLLAISGLHVGLVASLVYLFSVRLWRWSGGAGFCAAPRVAAVMAMLAAGGYALLSGFEVPAQRAAIMVCAWMGAILVCGESRPWPVLALALWTTLLCTPLAVLTAGFWLSYGAVAWILFLSLGRHGSTDRWRRGVGVQLALVAGLTPLLWAWFGQVPVAASLANLVAIPWVGLLVVPPLLLALVLLPVTATLADALLSLAAVALKGLWWFLENLASATTAWQWPAPAFDAFGFALLVGGLVLLLLPAATGIRLLGALLLLPALSASAPRPAPGDVWLTVLDVGQGLATVVETHRHVLVYDTGPAYPGGFDSGAQVLVPFLSRRGYRALDRLVVSHSDNDHSGGAQALARTLPVASVHAGEPEAIGWTTAAACRTQSAWRWDDVTFAYLVTSGATGDNNRSCVLKVTARDGRGLLLPGDIELPVENALLARQRDKLAARVLVAPHHGSTTSSGRDFIAAVKPDWVVFATGYRNRFGFPRPGVVARYRDAGAQTIDTASAGAVLVRVDAGRRLAVESWRARHPRLWRTGD